MDRLAKLLAMLEKSPADAFLLYGVAMEYKKLGSTEQAVAHFRKTIEVDPSYCYAYYQVGQTLESVGRTDEAKQAYQAGIAAAERSGDAHARGEIQAALETME